MTDCTCEVRYNISFRFPEREENDPSDVARSLRDMLSTSGFSDIRVWAVINKVSQEVID